jgi:DNA-binding transcriptional regulator YdaS (Cro superfamily)
MDLQDYLSRRELKPSQFAAELGVPASTITRVLRNEREPGPILTLKIERATGGEVPRWKLRPDLWDAPKEPAQ